MYFLVTENNKNISFMLAKKGARLKIAKMSYDNQKIARTVYYAGEKRGTCRMNVLVSMSTNTFCGTTTRSGIRLELKAIFSINAF